MQTETTRSWYDFFKLSDRLSSEGWAFRGQAKAKWDIQSTLSRYLKRYAPESDWKEREGRAIKIFSRKAHQFISDPSALEDRFRCLALMQHHGAPTRLIDFSKSPFVAAYFALERATQDAAVYALNTPFLWKKSSPIDFPDLDRSTTDPRVNNNFEKYFLCNQYPLVWTGEPEAMDQRTVAQSGTFVIPGRLDLSINELLEQYEADEPLLIKIILPIRMRAEAIEGLYRMNITNATLFPDLDGLAKSMASELEMVWAGQSQK